MHEMSETCWCFPEVALEATSGTTWVTHHERALSDGTSVERNRTKERDPIVTLTGASRFL
jgi:hypothetical protein